MRLSFCNDLGRHGFSWIVDEPMTRTAHALAAAGNVWLVDPIDWPDAIDRALALGEPAGVLQLLDRHNRDCGALAERLGVPHLVAPDEVPGSPFECIAVKRMKRWRETALWLPETRTLVVAEAVGTNAFYTGGKDLVGVHILLRLTPPKALAAYEPDRLLVGHGEGLQGAAAATGLRHALRHSRRGLPQVLVRLPFAGRS
ncbi:MAG: hypothetical protein OEW52_04040 [Thermoleophilia bacterium]|nr:hypothetical protein [Thermoleophilia bacterium]MDH4338947.1 hypothetical protein [Thermoleophilia bacterium]MDH5280306.1 hypothetical protein [Thermoleophilia bacterium]